MWVTGQMHDSLVRLTTAGRAGFVAMPRGSGPHGIVFDSAGRLWVTLEFAGKILMLDKDGKRLAEHKVDIDCPKCPIPDNPQPHGLGLGPDGRTIWFTGKTAGVVGRIDPDGKVTTFPLSSPDSLPIYIKAGPDGNMWVTMLAAGKIARVTPEGVVTEFVIPTENSRPIAIVPGPDGAMWFSEEAGSKVARITMDGKITEFAVPRSDPRLIVAGLAFDAEGNLWTQQYMPHKTPDPNVADSIVRIDRSALNGRGGAGPFTFYPVPTRDTVMHRIIRGPDGNMWFTEMNADKVGRLAFGR
jgi:virginiamycin B lyase